MKVFCVNSGTPGKTRDNLGNKGVYVPKIIVGNEYTVVDIMHNGNDIFYELSEVPSTDGYCYYYDSKMFTHLSDIEESELVNNLQESHV